MNYIEQEIQEALETQLTLIRAVIANDELRKLNAEAIKLSYDSFIEQGFSNDDAIRLVCASIKKV